MIKCQNRTENLFLFFLGLLLTISISGYRNEKESLLQRADSLFEAKKYTESIQIFESLEENDISTPSMYLKMAYIKEALDDVSGSLYYLNKYYLATHNSMALKKMESFSEENALAGYGYDDIDFFRNLLFNYSDLINYFFLILIGSLFVYLFLKIRKGSFPQITIAFFIALLVIFLVNFNLRIDNSLGIINQDRVFLMDAPSAGSEPISYVNEGHKVNVIKEDGAWYEILWEGEQAFIKRKNIALIKKEDTPVVWLLSRIKPSINKD